jgi:hypothetical protein
MTLTLIAMVFVERPLHAYADPGSGLLMWQLLGAVFLGAIYQVRRVVRKLRGFASHQTMASQPPANAEADRR